MDFEAESEQAKSRGLIFRLFGLVAAISNGFAAYIALPFMAIVIAVDVFSRYLLNAPITGAVEITQMLLLTFFVLGASYVTFFEHHIRMDLFANSFNRPVGLVVEFISMLCGLLLFGALAYQSSKDISLAIMLRESTEELHIPKLPFHVLMMVAFMVVALQVVLLMIRKIIYPEPPAADIESTDKLGAE